MGYFPATELLFCGVGASIRSLVVYDTIVLQMEAQTLSYPNTLSLFDVTSDVLIPNSTPKVKQSSDNFDNDQTALTQLTHPFIRI